MSDAEPRAAAERAPPRRILLATDLSCRCDRALDRAVQLAMQWGAKLHVLHVLDRPEPDDLPSWRRGRPVEAVLAERQIRAAMEGRQVATEVILEHGDPAETILRQADALGCDLLVTGIARAGTLARAVLGTTVERVVHRLPMPVLVVKTRPHRPYAEVLVASDFSASSRHALQHAMRLFPAAHMVLLHAYRVPFEGFLRKEANRDAFLGEAQSVCASFLDGLAAPREAVARLECLIEYGSPDEIIGAYAWDRQVDLAIMGTHGAGGAFDRLVGSTAERLVASLPCDVMVVREPRSAPALRTRAQEATPRS